MPIEGTSIKPRLIAIKKAEDLNKEGQKQAKDIFEYLDFKYNKKIE